MERCQRDLETLSKDEKRELSKKSPEQFNEYFDDKIGKLLASYQEQKLRHHPVWEIYLSAWSYYQFPNFVKFLKQRFGEQYEEHAMKIKDQELPRKLDKHAKQTIEQERAKAPEILTEIERKRQELNANKQARAKQKAAEEEAEQKAQEQQVKLEAEQKAREKAAKDQQPTSSSETPQVQQASTSSQVPPAVAPDTFIGRAINTFGKDFKQEVESNQAMARTIAETASTVVQAFQKYADLEGRRLIYDFKQQQEERRQEGQAIVDAYKAAANAFGRLANQLGKQQLKEFKQEQDERAMEGELGLAIGKGVIEGTAAFSLENPDPISYAVNCAQSYYQFARHISDISGTFIDPAKSEGIFTIIFRINERVKKNYERHCKVACQRI